MFFLGLHPMPLSPVICLDPGHPSEVGRGAAGRHTTEIKVAWKVAVDLRKALVAQGYRVVMTKYSEDQFVTNRRRADIANSAHAALMVRLHCDDAQDTGCAVFYPTQPGRSHGVTGPSAKVLRETAPIAKRFHLALSKKLLGQLADRGLMSDVRTNVGASQGALTGSVFAKEPVVLVEMVVLTNPTDEDYILSKAGERRMVQALTAAVLAAIPASESPKGVKF